MNKTTKEQFELLQKWNNCALTRERKCYEGKNDGLEALTEVLFFEGEEVPSSSKKRRIEVNQDDVDSDHFQQDEEFPNDDTPNDDVDNDDHLTDDEVESEEIGEEMDSITDIDDYDEFDLSEDDKDLESESEVEIIEYDQENNEIEDIQLSAGDPPFIGDSGESSASAENESHFIDNLAGIFVPRPDDNDGIDWSDSEETGDDDVIRDDIIRDDSDVDKYIEVIEKRNTYKEKFEMTQIEIDFLIRNPPNVESGANLIEMAISSIIHLIKKEWKNPSDRVILKVFRLEAPDDKPIFISLRNMDALTPEVVLEGFEKVHQSTSKFQTTDVLGVSAFIIHNMQGAGRHHNPNRMSMGVLAKHKNKSILTTNSKKNCLPNSIILGMSNLIQNFSKTFGLVECDKGYYPYKFNTFENRNYVGNYPAVEFYPLKSMSQKQYTEFLEWYNSVKSQSFNNMRELIHYCRQDVKILMNGCLNFMFGFLETSQINPFLQAITIADAVMKAYRKHYLQPDTLAITPKFNYNSNFLHLQSKISLKWLVYMKEISNRCIKYEVKIPGTRYIADGFDVNSNTVYSFEGCYFHGHTCFRNRGAVSTKNPNDTMQNRYESTIKRLDRIRQLGYNVESIWECNFRRPSTKTVKFTLLKRVCIDDNDTLPFGF
ncbi:hypothetical protein DMENIID0001_041890 [Sergentomyia squamirostris]